MAPRFLSVRAALAILLASFSVPAYAQNKWFEVSRDRDAIIARDVTVSPAPDGDGIVLRRFAIGFPAIRSISETEDLRASMADFLLLRVRAHCKTRRVKIIEAVAMRLDGASGGPVNKYFERADGLEAQLPASATSKILEGICDGKVAKTGAEAFYELLREYRAR